MSDLEAARRALAEGTAAGSAGRPAEASERFRVALEHLDGAPPGTETAYLRGRVLLALAVSELELTGDAAAAGTRLVAAARWAREAGSDALAVAVLGQLGLVRLRTGDTTGSLAALDEAATRLDAAEALDACRILLNRGALLLDLGRIAEARADFEACAERAEAAGDALRLFKARHNLGYAHFLAGDLPAALAAMTEAAAVEHGASPAVALLDRAQVLLEAGLVTEADQLLGEAAELFAADRLEHDLAQVELTRARCALLAREPERALGWAGSARERFAARGTRRWLAHAELVETQARLEQLRDSGGATRTELLGLADRALAIARRHGGTGAMRLRQDAHLTAAEALAAAGERERAAAQLEQVGRVPLPMAVRARAVRAGLALAEGDRVGARRHVRAGQRLLAEHRRQLGSVEAVAAAAVHGVRLGELDVGAALADGDALGVLDAVERGRAVFAGPVRVRPPEDPDLSRVLSELRRCVERHRGLDPDGPPAVQRERDELARRVARLRREARERSWQVGEGLAGERAPRPAAVRAAVRRSGVSVLDVLVHGGQVWGLVVDAVGARLERLAPLAAIAEPLRRVRTDLEMLARPLAPQMGHVVAASLERGLARLEELLLRPVVGAGPLHVVASGELATLPWGSLPSRRGRPTSVASRLVLADGAAPPAGQGVVAVAGPGLEHAGREVAEVAARWPGAVTREGARCAQVVEDLARSRVVHLAAHGHHETDNPVFSWVLLEDGPLFAHELEGVRLPGSVVVLSACEVGRVTERPGGEALGMASVLLRRGARAVVAALAPLRDELAARVMPELHAALAGGAGPQEALARACEAVGEPVPLTCFAEAVV